MRLSVLTLFLLINTIYSNIIDLNGQWQFVSANGSIKGMGNVPGDIYNDLYENKLVEHLLYADNDKISRWVTYTDWNYTKEVTIDEEPSQGVLEFDGLDTVSQVFVNGHSVGKSENQFVKYSFDTKKLLKKGKNLIVVAFRSPVKYAKEQANEFKTNYSHVIWPECPPDMFRGECHGNMIRKMQSSFSWDWGPAFPTVGIWQPARLVISNKPRIEKLNARVESAGENFIIHIDASIASPQQAKLRVRLDELSVSETFVVPNGKATVNITVAKSKVELWWPNGYGKQKLYTVDVGIDKETSLQNLKVGFRTVELVQDLVDPKKKDAGRNFYFKVNGVRVFLKGSNWIPVSAFPAQNNSARFEFLLKSAQEVGMNAMRIWGGGRYEDDQFYRLCDQYGILIWHDLMFACSLYPAHPEFLKTVQDELEYNINRLKHHPSILLWAGNNENELGLHDGWFSGASSEVMRREYLMLYQDLAKRVATELDPERPYVLSSPGEGKKGDDEGGISNNPNSEKYGDIHFYNEDIDLWSDDSYRTPRCATEYGVQSYPSKDTVLDQIPPSDYTYGSSTWLHRQHHPGGTENNLAMIFSHFPIPTECKTFDKTFIMNCPFLNSTRFFERFSYFSQAHQALAYKVQTEHYRRFMNKYENDGKGNTMCALYWQLNDIWAAPTWSSIDYNMKWKMAHYEAKRFFQQVHTVLYLSKNTLYATVVNDNPKDLVLTVEVSMIPWRNGFQPVFQVVKNVSATGSSATSVDIGSKINSYAKKNDLEEFVYVAKMKNAAGAQVGVDSVVIPDAMFKVGLGKNGDVRVSEVKKLSPTSYDITIVASDISALTWVNVNKQFRGYFSDNGFTMVEKTRKVTLTLFEPLELSSDDFTVCNLKTCGDTVPFN